MSGGSLLGAASVVGWSQARTLPQLYLAFVGVGVAGAMVLYEPAFALVNTWFDRDRHTALLALTVVAGFSSTIFIPGSQLLVDAYGWRPALLVLAALLGACAVPQALFLRRAPADLELRPDGAAGPVEAVPTAPAHEVGDFAGLAGDARGDGRVGAPGGLPRRQRRERGRGGPVGRRARRAVGGWPHHADGARDEGGTRPARRGDGRRPGAGRRSAAGPPPPVRCGAVRPALRRRLRRHDDRRAALLGTSVPPSVLASVSGGQALAANAGRVAAPLAAGSLITVAGYGPTFALVGACSIATALLLVAAECAHAGRVHPSFT
jgi:MFS family permease